MRRIAIVSAIAIAMLIGPIVRAGSLDSAVEIVNESMWNIHELYLSSVDDEEWGPDQLGQHVIESGASHQISGIPCDAYDVKIVDEDGDECVVGGVALCADKDAWVISDEDLLTCQVLTEE
jgi:hypothetical protein